jgi:hypothetical protein
LFFGDGFFLHYSKDKIQNYLVSGDFRIGGEQVCMNPNESISSFNNNQSEGGISGECELGVWGKGVDEVVVQLDIEDKVKLYKYNNLTQMYNDNLFYYSVMKDETLTSNLFNKPFMYFKDSCKDEDKTKFEKVREREFQNLEFNTVALVLIITSSIGTLKISPLNKQAYS